jgi:uncharacterized membrane protein HdeD (DUF308 family)
LARYLRKIPTNGFTIALGAVAFVLGALALFRPVPNIPPIDVLSFPVLLIVIGLYLLIAGIKRAENA